MFVQQQNSMITVPLFYSINIACFTTVTSMWHMHQTRIICHFHFNPIVASAAKFWSMGGGCAVKIMQLNDEVYNCANCLGLRKVRQQPSTLQLNLIAFPRVEWAQVVDKPGQSFHENEHKWNSSIIFIHQLIKYKSESNSDDKLKFNLNQQPLTIIAF